ncbi:MAG: helix-turn-helix transcriptional regulator [Candidatus Levybacteria bacterium]|nr:helix-turn-helix transcriptional regulator [Candidatus Levybacteria bacterium]
MANTKERLGKKIQRLRKNLDITQEELAEKTNMSRTHIGHIEQGRKSPSIKVIEKLARVLKVKVGELFS